MEIKRRYKAANGVHLSGRLRDQNCITRREAVKICDEDYTKALQGKTNCQLLIVNC
jgi:hypothetical protein